MIVDADFFVFNFSLLSSFPHSLYHCTRVGKSFVLLVSEQFV